MADPVQTRRCESLSATDADKIFFPGRGGKSKKAQAFCNGCFFKSECLETAMIKNLQGFWAGTTDKDRREMLKLKDELLHDIQLRREKELISEYEGFVKYVPEPGRRVRKKKIEPQYGYLDEIEPSEEELLALV